MKNVLITGAAGFTAQHLVKRLRAEGNVRICGTDVAAAAPNCVELDEYVRTDLMNATCTVELLQNSQPDWIFHLAGLFRGGVSSLYGVNVVASLNLFEAVRTEVPQAAVLVIGSAAEYGTWPESDMPLSEAHPCRPDGAYGSSKFSMTLAAQSFFRANGLKVVIARPFNLIGAGLPVSLVVGAIVQRSKKALQEGHDSISVGNISSRRDFIAVEDAVDAYVKLLASGKWGEVFNVCSGEAHSIESIIQILLSFSPEPIRIVEDENLKRANDLPVIIGDPSKAQAFCGRLSRISLHDSLRAAWDGIGEAARIAN